MEETSSGDGSVSASVLVTPETSDKDVAQDVRNLKIISYTYKQCHQVIHSVIMNLLTQILIDTFS